jgi:DNA-binding NarL/FixJ family response regulator
MLRAGLEALLRASPEVQVVFVADSLAEAQGPADVVVALDADPEDIPRPDVPPVILIAAEPAADLVRAALRAGARGVLSQDCTPAELHAALQAAAAGLTTLRPADAEALTNWKAPLRALPANHILSAREMEVLRFLADGLANKEIAFRLGISEHTVKFHVNSILTRLDAASRAEAVAIGIRRGLILL